MEPNDRTRSVPSTTESKEIFAEILISAFAVLVRLHVVVKGKIVHWKHSKGPSCLWAITLCGGFRLLILRSNRGSRGITLLAGESGPHDWEEVSSMFGTHVIHLDILWFSLCPVLTVNGQMALPQLKRPEALDAQTSQE